MNPLTTVTDTINRIMFILMALTALVVIVAIIYLWGKYKALTPGMKFLVNVALVLVGIIYALSIGWLAHDDLRKLGIPTSFEEATDLALHLFYKFDGWVRAHQWVGLFLAASIPLFLWPSKEREYVADVDNG